MAWVEYGPNQRMDPDTGAVQYKRGDNWQDIGNTQRTSEFGKPLGTGNWGWAMPTQEQLQNIKMMQQFGAGKGAAGPAATAAQRSFLGQDPTIMSGRPGGPGGANVADAGLQPEEIALRQMGQIDPATEALRQAVARSYLTPLQQAGAVSAPPTGVPTLGAARAPAAGDVQSYLDLYKKIDPAGYAQRVALGGGMSDYLKGAQQQAALGAGLDPQTIREITQQTRAGQMARGNVYGTPQLVQEAMERGTAGEARRQQRQAALSGALGQQQSYLGAGLGVGDVANTLYQQGFGRNLSTFGAGMNTYQAKLGAWQAQQQARQQAQQGALSYMTSGQTPYQAGASYLGSAENRAGAAAQGGPQYNPSALGQQYQAAQFPQYGLDMSQNAANWYNLMSAYNQPGAPQKNRMMGAAAGALGGAASGALAGAPTGIGAPVGALVGAVGGAASGYFS